MFQSVIRIAQVVVHHVGRDSVTRNVLAVTRSWTPVSQAKPTTPARVRHRHRSYYTNEM